MTPPTAEGGALRSQDIRTAGDPTGLDGRSCASTRTPAPRGRTTPTPAAPTPTRGGSSPTACATRSASRSGRHGRGLARRRRLRHAGRRSTAITDPTSGGAQLRLAVLRGRRRHAVFDNLDLTLCENALARRPSTAPFFTYNHTQSIVTGDGCGTGSSSIAGLAFLPSSSRYPAATTTACSSPTTAELHLVHARTTQRARRTPAHGPVREPDRRTRADGGAVPDRRADRRPRLRRLRPGRGPPHPLLRRERAAGRVVHRDAVLRARRRSRSSFNAVGSTDANGGTLTYAWDLDGDGAVRRRDRRDDLAHVHLGGRRRGRPAGDRHGRRRATRRRGPSRPATRRRRCRSRRRPPRYLVGRPDRSRSVGPAPTPRTGRCPRRPSSGP